MVVGHVSNIRGEALIDMRLEVGGRMFSVCVKWNKTYVKCPVS